MATFTNAQAFARHVSQSATVMERAQRDAIFRAVTVGKEALLAAPGAPHHIAGKAVGVRYSVTKAGVQASGTVQWTGPAHLVDRDTRAHEIEARRGSAVGLPHEVQGSRVRIRVAHPGTHGKHFFAAGEEAAARLIPPVLKTTYHTALARHFG